MHVVCFCDLWILDIPYECSCLTSEFLYRELVLQPFLAVENLGIQTRVQAAFIMAEIAVRHLEKGRFSFLAELGRAPGIYFLHQWLYEHLKPMQMWLLKVLVYMLNAIKTMWHLIKFPFVMWFQEIAVQWI